MEPRHERGFDFEGTLKWQPILEPKKKKIKVVRVVIKREYMCSKRKMRKKKRICTSYVWTSFFLCGDRIEKDRTKIVGAHF
jgi:hypothetical protein